VKSKRPGVLIFVISGPSGSGKTTLAELLLKHRSLKNKLLKSVSLTTRPRRQEEKAGEDYFFVSENVFKKLKLSKKILEWTRYLGYYYGTPKSFVDKHLAAGKHLVMCLDVKGALRVKKLYPHNTVTVFVVPPTLEGLRYRIQKRSEVCASEINKRLAEAKKEIALIGLYDYQVVNKDLEEARKCLRDIVLKEIKAQSKKE